VAHIALVPHKLGAPINYRIARIPKGGNKHREIYIASPEDNNILRGLLPNLESILKNYDNNGVNYAFEKKKNCALNALQHIGYRYTLSMDLENFFDRVTPQHVAGIIPDTLIAQCFLNGNPKQGLPTSPLIATIAFLPCDKMIVDLFKKFGVRAVYTRYADDLIFSFDDQKYLSKIKVLVRQTVERLGFKINDRKTILQDAKNGRKIITGIAIDHNGIYPTRRTRKKIRAANHQQNALSLRGLNEWSKCKLPKQCRPL
jgi:hypothetical protein